MENATCADDVSQHKRDGEECHKKLRKAQDEFRDAEIRHQDAMDVQRKARERLEREAANAGQPASGSDQVKELKLQLDDAKNDRNMINESMLRRKERLDDRVAGIRGEKDMLARTHQDELEVIRVDLEQAQLDQAEMANSIAN